MSDQLGERFAFLLLSRNCSLQILTKFCLWLTKYDDDADDDFRFSTAQMFPCSISPLYPCPFLVVLQCYQPVTLFVWSSGL